MTTGSIKGDTGSSIKDDTNKRKKETNTKERAVDSTSFLKEVKCSPAYMGVDIDKELAKMDVWLLAHPGRKKTKRFIINWLNKVEVLIQPEKQQERIVITGRQWE